MKLFRRPLVTAHHPPRILRAGVAFVALSIGLACSLLFRLFFGSGTFLLFFGAVAVIAAYSGLRFGLVSVFVSLILLNYFDFPPFDTLTSVRDKQSREFGFNKRSLAT